MLFALMYQSGSAGFPMRVMNPTGEEITVYKGHIVANFNHVLD